MRGGGRWWKSVEREGETEGGGGGGRLSDEQIGRQADIHRGADDGVKKKTQMK